MKTYLFSVVFMAVSLTYLFPEARYILATCARAFLPLLGK
jgi:hypothetical protein